MRDKGKRRRGGARGAVTKEIMFPDRKILQMR